jgi:hypothetical protein
MDGGNTANAGAISSEFRYTHLRGVPAFAGMTSTQQASGNYTLKD